MFMGRCLHDTSLAIPFHKRSGRLSFQGTDKFARLHSLDTQLLENVKHIDVVIGIQKCIDITQVNLIIRGVGLIRVVSG